MTLHLHRKFLKVFEKSKSIIFSNFRMVVRAQLGRILLGNRAGAGRFAAVCVAGALCLELIYAPMLDG